MSGRSRVYRYRHIVRFFAIMAAAYAVWYGIYNLWLLPDGRLDDVVGTFVAQASAGVLNVFGAGATWEGRVAALPGNAGIYVSNGCNGLDLISLFIGFVVAYPGRWSHRAWFIPLGLVLIVVVNIIRCAGLMVAQDVSQTAFDIAHGPLVRYTMFALVFALWVAWANLSTRSKSNEGGDPASLSAHAVAGS